MFLVDGIEEAGDESYRFDLTPGPLSLRGEGEHDRPQLPARRRGNTVQAISKGRCILRD